MSLFVLDASVAVAWLLGEDTASRADLALVRLEDDEALVPNLWHSELRNGLLVAGRRGRFTADGPAERLNALYDLPIRTDTEPDLDIAFALAERHGLSFYDAIYLELAAVSIGRCNTSIKSLCRCLEPQCFARPLVQLPRHVVEMCLRVYRQVCSFGEVLSQQSIGVLIGSALPRALRIAEVNIDIGRQA